MRANRRRALLGSAVVLLGAGAVGAALVLSPGAVGETSSAAATPTAPLPANGSGAATPTAPLPADAPEAATPTAPYTLGPEPTSVATDEPRPSDAGIDVVLSYVGYEPSTGTVQANGLVAGVVADGGLCTLTLTDGDDEVTATSEAFADATTTSCGLVETGPGIASGTWEAVLSYSGVDSASVQVTVP
ncbi:hypothetical protein [Geodermatophilus amargosae]|uniref:hypothetical protein n=1 Tax=Geodermatophilus amargosae TaxID=1296565 RepID=UPI0034DE1D1A